MRLFIYFLSSCLSHTLGLLVCISQNSSLLSYSLSLVSHTHVPYLLFFPSSLALHIMCAQIATNGATMNDRMHQPVNVMAILVPICPHLLNHPIFNRRDDLVRNRVTDAIAREFQRLMVEHQEGNLDVSRDESELGMADMSLETAPASDGCVTAHSGDFEVADWEEAGSVLSEGDFIAGIRRSSSPRPGGSCCNRRPASPTEGTSGLLSTKPISIASDSDSDDSSDLPTFKTPSTSNIARRTQRGLPPAALPVNIDISSSESDLNLTSVSQQLPPNRQLSPLPPPPLANVSMSEVRSCSTTVSLSDGSHRSLPNNVTLRRGRVNGPRGASVIGMRRHRPGRMDRATRLRVARWLLDQYDSSDEDIFEAPAVVGGPLNPIVISDDSDCE